MRTVGLIGAGKIGGPVIAAFQSGEFSEYELVCVLTRTTQNNRDGSIFTVNPEVLWQAAPDIVIEAAGGDWVRDYGERALMGSDLWLTSGAALADASLRSRMIGVARSATHELRVLTGALAGLDAISTAAVDPTMTLSLQICIGPGDKRRTVFQGSVAEAAALYPEEINVSVAAALAGHGPEHTEIEVIQPGPGQARELRFTVESRYGRFETCSIPGVVPAEGVHVVAANIIASLHGDAATLRVR